MGTSQSTTNVNNQITNIHASQDSVVNTNNSNISDLQALLQNGLPYLVILLSILLLLCLSYIVYLLRRVRSLRLALKAAKSTLLQP